MRVALLAAALSVAPLAHAAGNADKGARLHNACLQCHGTDIYVPPKSKLKSLKSLLKEVARWADYYNPKFSKQEMEDLTAYLNRDFYKFPP